MFFLKKRINNDLKVSNKYLKYLSMEKRFGIEKLNTYKKFARNVKKFEKGFIKIFKKIKNNGKIIIGYGATYKSSTVLNYCGLKNNFMIISWIQRQLNSMRYTWFTYTYLSVQGYSK